jgi:hypothetical protein
MPQTMNEMLSIRFDSDDRRTIDEARTSWNARQLRLGPRIDMLPPCGGPDPAGKMTLHWLDSEFIDYLRARGLQFDLI